MPTPKKTVGQRVREGTYNPKKHGPVPVTPDGAAVPPKKPAGLTAAEAVLWDDVMATRKGLVFASDGPALHLLCRWWAMLPGLVEELAETNGRAANGVMVRLGIATDKVTSLFRLFGMTPQDRAKVEGVAQAGPAKAQVATRPATKLDRRGAPKKGGG